MTTKTNAKDLKGKAMFPKEQPKPGLQVSYTEDVPPKRGTFLVYGQSGAGKTHFAGTFPKPLFLDMFGGLATLRKKKIAYIRPKSYMAMLQATLPSNLEEYDTIVIDHITEAGRIIMKQVIRESQREVAQIQDWGLGIERLRRIIVALTAEEALPDKHIVVCAEEKLVKDEQTGQVTIGPSSIGQMAQDLPTYFDVVLHLRNAFNPVTKTKGRYALTEPDGRYPAKDRFGVLDKLEIPDFKVIWDKIIA